MSSASNKDAVSSQRFSRQEEEIATIELHPNARSLIEELTLDFGSALLLQSKIIAHQRRDEFVLRNHVLDSLDVLHSQRKEKWWKSFVTILGGVLFGAGARGFITELQSSRHPTIILIYVILAFIGLLLAVYPLTRR